MSLSVNFRNFYYYYYKHCILIYVVVHPSLARGVTSQTKEAQQLAFDRRSISTTTSTITTVTNAVLQSPERESSSLQVGEGKAWKSSPFLAELGLAARKPCSLAELGKSQGHLRGSRKAQANLRDVGSGRKVSSISSKRKFQKGQIVGVPPELQSNSLLQLSLSNINHYLGLATALLSGSGSARRSSGFGDKIRIPCEVQSGVRCRKIDKGGRGVSTLQLRVKYGTPTCPECNANLSNSWRCNASIPLALPENLKIFAAVWRLVLM